ncbi:uncharacterized protein LOC130258470 [Oenanthe melanoleuca]|uniref:uncharacterized protein LOC130258470 n=1 Tax=Oenanthe melanoleuca TaxID=2939378 RepID=UPI0024C17859|nr:uncharacterized protein LOC130258470 [Oenanthe melanoleuca]
MPQTRRRSPGWQAAAGRRGGEGRRVRGSGRGQPGLRRLGGAAPGPRPPAGTGTGTGTGTGSRAAPAGPRDPARVPPRAERGLPAAHRISVFFIFVRFLSRCFLSLHKECPSRRKSIPRRCHRRCPCRGPPLLLRGRFSPRPAGGLDPGPGAALPGFGDRFGPRLLLEEATRERGLAGAWEAGMSLLCPAASQMRDPRHREVPVAAGEQRFLGYCNFDS